MLVSVEEYRSRVLASVTPLAPRPTPLRDCLGLVLAEDVVSDISVPRFDNSSMDGYAVRAFEVLGASEEEPVQLPVHGESAAGGGAPAPLLPGTAAKIMTGAPLHPGADAVVPYEWTNRGSSSVLITRAPDPGAHVRRVGEDITAGTTVLAQGTRLGPRQLALAAAVGRADLVVHRRPRIAIISTGTELRQPEEPLGPSGLFDSNATMLATFAERAGATVVHDGHVADSNEAFLAMLDGLDADVVVTSGGISMGDYDIVKASLAPRRVWFGGVAMQPGKPQGFGRVGDSVLLAMPGNPVSSYISFHEFVLPVLRRLMGITPEVEAPSRATLANGLSSPSGKRQFLRGRHLEDGTVETVGGPGSHLLGGLAGADCLIVIDEECTSAQAGDEVDVISLAGF